MPKVCQSPRKIRLDTGRGVGYTVGMRLHAPHNTFAWLSANGRVIKELVSPRAVLDVNTEVAVVWIHNGFSGVAESLLTVTLWEMWQEYFPRETREKALFVVPRASLPSA